MLKYALYKSNLPTNSNKFVAITQVDETATLEDLIDDITSRGSTVTRAEVLSVWEELTLSVKNRLLKGRNIGTNLFYYGQDIKGEFENADDYFKEGRNSVVINIASTDFIRQIAAQVSVQKVEPNRPMPVIRDFTDFGSQGNSQLTLGNVARLTGSSLKIDGTDALQGIFLIDVAAAETKVSTLIDNSPSTLTFTIPTTLAAGVYKLEVRVKLNNTKELRTVALAQTLTV
jgi:hypothetical protein